MPSIPSCRGRISNTAPCKSPKRHSRAGMFAQPAAQAATSPTSSLSDNRATAAGSTSKPALLRAEHQWAGTSTSDDQKFINGTVSASSADALPRRALPGVTPGIRRPSRARSIETDYICPHDDCGRVFRRKTSLTNHVKAHSNANSRSILRTKRLRKQVKLAQMNAQKAAERQQDALREQVQKRKTSMQNVLQPYNPQQQYVHQPHHQQTKQRLSQAYQRQHQMPQQQHPQELQHIRLPPELAAFSKRPTSLPWSALSASPDDETDAGCRGHGAQEAVEVFSSVAAQVADLKLEAQLAQFVPNAPHPATLPIDDVELCPPAMPPWTDDGASSFALSTEILAGFDGVLAGDECSVPFGEFQGECVMPLESDLSYQQHLEALTSFVIPENGIF